MCAQIPTERSIYEKVKNVRKDLRVFCGVCLVLSSVTFILIVWIAFNFRSGWGILEFIPIALIIMIQVFLSLMSFFFKNEQVAGQIIRILQMTACVPVFWLFLVVIFASKF